MTSDKLTDGAVTDSKLTGPIAATKIEKAAQVVTVALTGGDFNSIQAALDAIDSGPETPYLVQVMPASYTSFMVLKNYVTIRGAGKDVTTVTLDPNFSSTVYLYNVSNVEVSGFALVGGGIDDTRPVVALAFPRRRSNSRATRGSVRQNRHLVVLATAALFGLHPLRVESVAWVAERKDVLSLFFFLLTCCAWRWHLARPSQRRYGLTLLLFAFALMAKSMVVTLPLLLLLLDWWPLGRWNGRDGRRSILSGSAGLLAEKAPFLVLSVAAGILAVIAQRSEGALVGLQRYPLETRLASAGVSYVSYLGKTIWPFGLSAFYPHPSGIPAWQWLGSAVSLAVLTVLALAQARRRPWLATSWLWYLVALVPVIGLVQVGAQSMADRYTYLPSIGLGVAAVWAASETKVLGRSAGWLSGAVVAGLLMLYCSATWIQCGYWRNDFTLFSHASDLDPGNWLAHNNVGRQLLLQKRWPEAEERIRESIKYNPNNSMALYNLGVAAREQGRAVEAEASFREAVRLKPSFLQARMDLGKLLNSLGRPTEAQREFEEAVRLAPENADAHLNLGVALHFQDKPDLALLSYEKAYRLNPNMPEVLSNLGRSLSDQGRNQEALPFLQRALEVKPEFVVARYNLGMTFERLGRLREAEEEYQRVLALRPDFRPAQEALNRLLGRDDRSRP